MHAGVFEARITEEAFNILLDVVESNLAALSIPEKVVKPGEKNQVDDKKIVVISRRRFQTPTDRNCIVFQDNFNLKISRLVKIHRNQEIREVFEIVFPVQRNIWPDKSAFVMSNQKSLEDSHEPMEIEEISYTESTSVNFEPSIKKETEPDKDVKIIADSRPKTILRESKLSKIFEGEKITEKTKVVVEPDCSDEKNSADSVQITNNNSEIQKTKSKIRPLVMKNENHTENGEKSTFFYFWQMLFFILFPIAVLVASVSIAREEFDSEVCAHRFSANQAIRDLKNRVFGQTRAIEELSNHLEVNSSTFRVLILIGGTGVGKSYTAHIISENFPAKKNLLQYVPPLKPRRKFAVGGVSICGCNLIILENLNNKDMEESANFVEHLAKKVNNDDYCLILILVINVQETDENLKHKVDLSKSKREIDNIYRNKNLNVQIVEFEPLDDEVVTKCILDVAETKNLKLSKSEIEDIKISLKAANSGCKGAHAKVQLLDKKWV